MCVPSWCKRFTALFAIALGSSGVALPTAYADHDEDSYGANNQIGTFFEDQVFWVTGIETNPTSSGPAVVAGAYCQDSTSTATVCLVGIDSDGHVDTSFGDNGFVTHTPTDALTLSVINRMQFDPQGRIVVASFCERYEGAIKFDYDTMDMCITRYLSDGSVDRSFGTTADNVANAPMIRYQNPSALVFPDDGRIIAGGYCSSSPCLVGFTPDGKMDETFGDGEYEIGGSWIPEFDDGSINDLALLPDGGYVGVGTCSDYDSNISGMCVIAWNEDGSRRTSFADNGVRYFVQGENTWGESIVSLDDGTTIAGGKCNLVPGKGATPCLLATSSDGSAATSFGSNGVVEIPDMEYMHDVVRYDTVIFAIGQCPSLNGLSECVFLFDEDGSPTEQYVHAEFAGSDIPSGSFNNSPFAAVTVEHVWFSQPCEGNFYTSMCLSRTRYHSLPVETTTTISETSDQDSMETTESTVEPESQEVTDDELSATTSSGDTPDTSTASADPEPGSGSSSSLIVVIIAVALVVSLGAGIAFTKRKQTP